MKTQSRHIVHAGINFISVPVPVVVPQTLLAFQQAVLAHGLEYNRLEAPKNTISLFRDAPYPLQITVSAHESQVGQLLILTPQPKGSLDLFIQEAEAAIQAYESIWSVPNRQIIQADATIRQLYETTSQHAFQELWESRLGQTSQALSAFGRPIRGGGLRFVMDPVVEDLPAQIEVKIESFLLDTTKVFVETQFTWPALATPQSSFSVRERIKKMDSYIETNVQAFISGERK
ncbi:MAG: hypothetical protein HYU84_03425 [Chloroflexi bacterium]|nr:hypothetical protein [Chloroflexota bacterium]MBI3169870.1 hypothetical protein [Chloroflexota bacterium]